MNNSLVVVIRSAGERTERACAEFVTPQMDNLSLLHEVKGVSFDEAHIRSIRLAVESGARWAVFLDADVLLRPNAIRIMLAEAEALPSPFYMLNFRVVDLGFDGPAFAGVHLYTVEYLTRALDFEEQARQDQRPETRMVFEMKEKRGVNSMLSTTLVGLHGYEQYYRDLYRTSFVRGVKFKIRRDYILPTLRARCFRGADTDLDYQVMLWGWLDGSIYALDHEKAPLDALFYRERAGRTLEQLNLREKGEYIPNPDQIERTILHHTTDARYAANRHWLCPVEFFPPAPPPPSLPQRIRRILGGLKRRIARI
jgi:hypothetical protein